MTGWLVIVVVFLSLWAFWRALIWTIDLIAKAMSK